MNEIDRILEEEGFSATPYPDPIHGWDKPTFGHGLTYITEKESRRIAESRLQERWDAMDSEVYEVTGLDLYHGDELYDLINILSHMAYQLGVQGVRNFKKMWAAIGRRDFKTAAAEMRDSKWYTQTPERAERLAKRMEALA